MRKFLSILLMVTMVVSSMVVMATPANAADYSAPSMGNKAGAVGFVNGVNAVEPTATDANGSIMISTAEEMYWFLSQTVCAVPLTGNYILMNDFDLTGSSIKGLADDFAPSTATFSGTFDGNGHTVWGVKVTAGDDFAASYIFANVTGAVQNVKMQLEIAGSSRPTGFVNVLDGGIVSNVHIDANYHTGSLALRDVAGIVMTAKNSATVTNCVLSGSITHTDTASTSNVAGIVGNASGVSVSHCKNYASITSSLGSVGGIVGASDAATTITDCVNYGDITVTAANSAYGVGGILGLVKKATTITNCVNYGTISGKKVAGGLVGIHAQAVSCLLQNSHNYGDVSSTVAAGGLVGYRGVADTAGSMAITSCHNYGAISCVPADVTDVSIAAGGLIGRMSPTSNWKDSTTTMTDCANFGDVTATQSAGGVVGFLSLQGSSARCNTLTLNAVVSLGTATSTAGTAGGLAGYIKSAIIDFGTESQISNYYGKLDFTNVYIAQQMAGNIDKITSCQLAVSGKMFVHADDISNTALWEKITPNDASVIAACESMDADFITSMNATSTYSWYLHHSALASTSGVEIDQATVDITEAGSIRLWLRMNEVEGWGLDVTANYNGNTINASKDGSTYTWIIPVNLADISKNLPISIGVDGNYGTAIMDATIIDVLASIYQNAGSSDTDRAMIKSIITFAYYNDLCTAAGFPGKTTTTVVEDFKAAIGDDTFAINALSAGPDAEAYVSSDSYSVALNVGDGFTVIVTDKADGSIISSTKVSIMAVGESTITLPDDSTTSVAAIIKAYVGNADSTISNVALAAYDFYTLVASNTNA